MVSSVIRNNTFPLRWTHGQTCGMIFFYIMSVLWDGTEQHCSSGWPLKLCVFVFFLSSVLSAFHEHNPPRPELTQLSSKRGKYSTYVLLYVCLWLFEVLTECTSRLLSCETKGSWKKRYSRCFCLIHLKEPKSNILYMSRIKIKSLWLLSLIPEALFSTGSKGALTIDSQSCSNIKQVCWH